MLSEQCQAPMRVPDRPASPPILHVFMHKKRAWKPLFLPRGPVTAPGEVLARPCAHTSGPLGCFVLEFHASF